ncbi:hypothetical protein ABPG75_007032 [Micractinium tetrahymenae]
MATKLKKQQKKKRWEGTGLSFPPALRAEVAALVAGGPALGSEGQEGSPELRRFAGLLEQLMSKGSAYAEMEALKPLTKFTVEWAASTQADQRELQQRHGRQEEAEAKRQRQQQLEKDGEEEPARRQQHAAELCRAQALLCNLLLLPSSRALHKQLLSGLRPLLERQDRQLAAGEVQQGETFAGIAAARIAELAGAYLAAAGSGGSDGSRAGDGRGDSTAPAAAAGAVSPAGPGSDALVLGSALAALLANAACKPALVDCAVPAVAALARGIRAVLEPASSESAAGAGGAGQMPSAAGMQAAAAADGEAARAAAVAAAGAAEGQGPAEGAAYITTTVMEGLQDCISAVYFLLSLFGREVLERQPEAAAAAVLAAGEALLLALQGQSLVRESLASAAVALYAAAALPAAAPAALARCLAQGLMLPAEDGQGCSRPLQLLLPTEAVAAGAAAQAPSAADAAAPFGLLDGHLRQRGASLAAELAKLSPISRVCAIRGLLSAIPAEVSCAPLVAATPEGPAQQPWLPLVDGALPAISSAIQNTTDEHFRFHAFSTLTVCLERIRLFQQQALERQGEGRGSERGEAGPQAAAPAGAAEEAAVPFLEPQRLQQLLQLLWQGFEAALSQTLQRVHTAFECLINIVQAQQQLQLPAAAATAAAAAGAAAPAGAAAAACGDGASADAVVLGIARDLLALDPSRKGRYAPLVTLTPRIGGRRLLALQPSFVAGCLEAMSQHVISSSVAHVLLALIAQLKQEAEGEAQQAQQTACVAGAAGSGGADTEQEGWRGAWLPLLAGVLCSGSEHQRDHITSHLLPRLLSLDPPALGLLLRRLLPGGAAAGSAGAAAASLAVLKAARKQQLFSELDSLPVAGLGAGALRGALLAAVRSSSEGLRVDALTLVCCNPRTTVLPTELDLEVASETIRLTLRCPNSSLKHKVLGPLGRLLMRIRSSVAALLSRDRRGSEATLQAVAVQERWLHWFGRSLVDSLYPGATHERSFMALELLHLYLDAFGDLINPALGPPAWSADMAALPPGRFDAFGPRFCTEGTMQLLLAAALDRWERLREAAAAVLLRLPTPLPGLATPAALRPLLACALRLLGCPRSRESDAGAQLLLLILRKYGGATGGAAGGSGGCCWRLDVARGEVEAPQEAAPASGAADGEPQQAQQQAAALWTFLGSACDLLERRIRLAEGDMLEACRGGLAQGVLLALRYSVPHIPWKRLAEQDPDPGRDWQGLVSRLLALCYAMADLTLPVLSKPQDQNMDAADVDAHDMDIDEADAELAGGEGADALGPRAQIIMTGCWQSSKEVGLLLGVLARCLPLEGAAALLTGDQLSHMASHFTHSLCALKHNGAIDKTQQGFTALCERLLQQPDPALRALPQRCLHQLLAFARRPGQGRSDIVRRSAGLPFGVVAIFYSEPANSPKVLLQRGMAELLAEATKEGGESWPRVHAINCMRAAFQDAYLAVDTSAYLAPGMQAAIRGMAAPQWEVRNAASLLFTALLVRVLGFRNHAGKGTVAAKRAPTAADFFARHPQLHPFLLQQLAAAAASLESSSSSSGGSSELHPSMFPVLVLLSRLRPSRLSHLSGSSGSSALAEQQLSPAPFALLLQRCAAASAAAVRQLAASALPPLLPPERQPVAAAELAAAVQAAVQAAAGSINASQQPSRPSFNALHGQLLQLRALLEAAADEGADASSAAALLAAVAGPLAQCAAHACCLGSAGSRLPAAVSLEYIRASGAAAALLSSVQRLQGPGAQEAAAATQGWLAAARQHCWQAVERSVAAQPPRDYCSPMLSCAYKHATQLCFTLLLAEAEQQQAAAGQEQQPAAGQAEQQGAAAAAAQCGVAADSGAVLQQLGVALQSQQYEVRCAALKVLLKHVQQARQAQQGEGALRRLLLAHLARERHHTAQRRTLHLLALLPPTAATQGTAAQAAGPAAGQEFAAVIRWATAAADSRVKQHAVCSLGPLLRQLLQGGFPPAAAKAAGQLLELAADCSQPSQLPELRLAAAEAQAASGLLLLDPAQPEAAAAAAAGAWEALLPLLDDDDEAVRGAASSAAAAAIDAFQQGGESSSGGGGGAAQLAAAGSDEPAFPSEERTLRRLFPSLAARFGPHPALLSLLCRLCCPAAAKGAAAAGSLDSSSDDGSGKQRQATLAAAAAAANAKIFDPEPDNMHEEPVLLAQLAAGALAQLLPYVAAGGAAAAEVQAWAHGALRLLPQAAAELASPAAEQAAPGVAPPCHARFAELYCAWLALWAAARLPADSWPQRSKVAAGVGALADGPVGAAAAAPTTPQLAAVAAAAAGAWAGDAEGQAGNPLFLL